MPDGRAEPAERSAMLGLWMAEDGSKMLSLWQDSAGIWLNVFAGLGPRSHVSGRPVTIVAEAKLRAELGEPGMGTTYELSAVVAGEDGRWRPATPQDSAAAVRLLGAHGASFYEAVLGAWDDFVEDINAGDAWAMPDTIYRRPTDEERMALHEALDEVQ